MSELWADVLIDLVPTESGGWTASLDLCNDRPGQYRPHLRVIGGSSEMLGVAFMDDPDEPVPPGGSTNATIKSLYLNVSYEELIEGARFEILEGPQRCWLWRGSSPTDLKAHRNAAPSNTYSHPTRV